VVPLVACLTHPDGPDASGKVFEVGGGFVAEIRWERSKGAIFKTDQSFTPSAIKLRWDEITDFAGATHPAGMGDQDPMVSSHFVYSMTTLLKRIYRPYMNSRRKWQRISKHHLQYALKDKQSS
jgi:hypothetical protein